MNYIYFVLKKTQRTTEKATRRKYKKKGGSERTEQVYC